VILEVKRFFVSIVENEWVLGRWVEELESILKRV